MYIKFTAYHEDESFYLDSALITKFTDCSNDTKLTRLDTTIGQFIVVGDFNYIAKLLNGEEVETPRSIGVTEQEPDGYPIPE